MTGQRKTFSVYGDSMSTLQGYQPEGYAVHYQGEFAEKSRVLTMEDTWWGMVIRRFGGELTVCNAYSGSMVSGFRRDRIAFPSGASEERMDALLSAGIPDVLMVCLGVNDWYQQVEADDFEEPWWRTFSGAYQHMTEGLRKRFPDTEIWCLNLTYSRNMKYYFYPMQFRIMREFNQVIAGAAARCGAKLIDLWSLAAEYESEDLAHPNRDGMEKIARAVIGSLAPAGTESPQTRTERA